MAGFLRWCFASVFRKGPGKQMLRYATASNIVTNVFYLINLSTCVFLSCVRQNNKNFEPIEIPERFYSYS